MKLLSLFLLMTAILFGGPCSSIPAGSGMYGPFGMGIDWGSFQYGKSTSTWRQNIAGSSAINANNTTWKNTEGGTDSGGWIVQPTWYTDNQNVPWLGMPVHYVHGNTQQHISVRGVSSYAKTSSNGSMTNGSAILTITNGKWDTIIGRQVSYFKPTDVGLAVTVSGAGSGGSVLSAYIASFQGVTQVTLDTSASTTVSSATVNVDNRSPINDAVDPGGVPMPFNPRIQGFYGPYSRPFARYEDPYSQNINFLLNRFQYTTGQSNGQNGQNDQHVFVVDVDNCISYELWDCNDDYSNISCGSYAAFNMTAGDLQRPYNLTSSNVAGMDELAGMVKWSEYLTACGGDPTCASYDLTSGPPIPHSIGFTFHYCCSNSFTGNASFNQYFGGNYQSAFPPFGSHFRLKSSWAPPGLPHSCGPFIRTLQTYGGIYIDGGINLDLRMEVSNKWPKDCLDFLYTNSGNNTWGFQYSGGWFDFIDVGNTNIYCSDGFKVSCPGNTAYPSTGYPTGAIPVISSFSASPSNPTHGTPFTLSWTVTGAVDIDGNPTGMANISFNPNAPTSACDWNISGASGIYNCTGGVGWVNGVNSITLTAPQTTGNIVYTLMANNRYGRSWSGQAGNAANVTVAVH